MKTDERTFVSYPLPLANASKLLSESASDLVRLHRAFDAFETLVVYCTTIALASQTPPIPIELKKKLALLLERPSLGVWMHLLECIIDWNLPIFVPELEGKKGYLQTHLITKKKEGDFDLVFQRKRLAHGGFLDKSEAHGILNLLLPYLESLFHEASFFAKYPLVSVVNNKWIILQDVHFPLNEQLMLKDGIYLFSDEVFRNCKNQCPYLSLEPFQIPYTSALLKSGTGDFDTMEATGLFYRRMQKRAVEYRTFRGQIVRSKALRREFLRTLPIDQWRHEMIKLDKYSFLEWRQELLKFFIGRELQVQNIFSWIQGNERHLFIYGKPGIGKSALIAQVIEKSNQKPPLEGFESYDVIYHFFRRMDERCRYNQFLEGLVHRLKVFYQRDCSLRGDLSEILDNLRRLLDRVAEELQNRKRELIIILDGIEDAIATGGYFILEQLPFLVSTPQIRWILTGHENSNNPYYAIKSFFEKRGISRLHLGSLTEQEVIAFLQESQMKYHLINHPQRDRLVQLVVQRSEGNPLYLQGLLDDLDSGRKQMEPEQFEKLPAGIEGFFEDSMQRLGVTGHSEESKAILLTLAWAIKPISIETIAVFSLNGFARRSDTVLSWTHTLEQTLPKLMSFLFESYSQQGASQYRLYPEGLRWYFRHNENLVSDSKVALLSLIEALDDINYDSIEIQSYRESYAALHQNVNSSFNGDAVWKIWI